MSSYGLLYMATTKSKYTAGSATNDDGVRDYPTSGSVTSTNSGKNSIIIGGNIKHGHATLSYETNLKMLKIDREIGTKKSNTAHTSLSDYKE